MSMRIIINISTEKIKDLKKEDFQVIKTKGDGNCLPRALLKSIEEEEIKHLELRQLITDLIEKENLAKQFKLIISIYLKDQRY